MSCLLLLAPADFLEFQSQEIDASKDNLWLEHELPNLGLLLTLYRNFNQFIVSVDMPYQVPLGSSDRGETFRTKKNSEKFSSIHPKWLWLPWLPQRAQNRDSGQTVSPRAKRRSLFTYQLLKVATRTDFQSKIPMATQLHAGK